MPFTKLTRENKEELRRKVGLIPLTVRFDGDIVIYDWAGKRQQVSYERAIEFFDGLIAKQDAALMALMEATMTKKCPSCGNDMSAQAEICAECIQEKKEMLSGEDFPLEKGVENG